MEDEPVHIIRESSRNLIKLKRQTIRDKQSDAGRNIEKTRVTHETIIDIVNKLKSKPSITAVELNLLKNSLFNDPNCTAVVLSTQGSLRGLVRELSGTDVKRQVSAAGCCCNLALGNAKTCMAVAKAAGPYLTTALDNQSMEIAVIAAWAVGNIAGSGAKACDTLTAQGALAKLTTMLASPHEEVSDAALYALTHFAYQMKDCLSKEYVEKLVNAILKLKLSMDSSRMLFIISCHSEFELTNEQLLEILGFTSVSIQKHCKDCVESDLCCETVFLIRTLANSNFDKTFMVILNYLETNNSVEYFKVILQSGNSTVVESLTWLLGNLYSYGGDSKLISMLLKE